MSTKPEFYELVKVMHKRFTPAEIGASLGGYSSQAIRNVLADLGLTERRRSFAERMRDLDATVRQRIENFAMQRRERQHPGKAA